jgi:hypothetical protein
MYLEFIVLKSFIMHLRSGKQNQNKETHGSISKHNHDKRASTSIVPDIIGP